MGGEKRERKMVSVLWVSIGVEGHRVIREYRKHMVQCHEGRSHSLNPNSIPYPCRITELVTIGWEGKDSIQLNIGGVLYSG